MKCEQTFWGASRNPLRSKSELAASDGAASYELEYSHGKYVILDRSKRFAMQVVSVHATLFDAEHALTELKGTPKFK